MRFTLLFVGLAIGLLAGEALVRLLGVAPTVGFVPVENYRLSPNPRIGYEPEPLSEKSSEKSEKSEKSYDRWLGIEMPNVTINQLGYRDREHALEKLPGTLRVVVLGDSIAAGWAVPLDQDIFPARLEESLQAHDEKAEVLNFGVVGYNTQQEVETLHDKALAYHPDWVVLAYCLNDTEEKASWLYHALLEKREYGDIAAPSRWQIFLTRSALYRLIRYFGAAKARQSDQSKEAKHIETLYKRPTEDSTEKSFADLARLQKQNNFRVLIVLFPLRGHLEKNLAFPESRTIGALAQKNGFAFLNLLTALEDCQKNDQLVLYYDEVHPNPDGYRCIAKAVAETIRRNP